VTDGRTDRQTDRIPIPNTRPAVPTGRLTAVAHKNVIRISYHYVLSKVYTGVGECTNHVSGVHEVYVVCPKTKQTFENK